MSHIVHLISAQTIQKGIECAKVKSNYELQGWWKPPILLLTTPDFQTFCHHWAYFPNTYTVTKGLFKKETISKLPSTKIHCISHQLQNLKIQCMKRSKIESLSISTLVTESKDSRAVLYFNIYDIHLLSTSIGLTSKKILWKIACVQKSFHDS